MSQYAQYKLKELNNQQITVNKLFGYKWKKWDETAKKYEVQDDWFKDAQKRYSLGIDGPQGQGYLEISSSQMAQMLEGTLDVKGSASIIGVLFDVKTNGKEGKEIRYYINARRMYGSTGGGEVIRQTEIAAPKEVSVDEIPF